MQKLRKIKSGENYTNHYVQCSGEILAILERRYMIIELYVNIDISGVFLVIPRLKNIFRRKHSKK